MTPRDRFTLAVDSLTSLSASDRLVLKAAGDEYAAGMIEAYARPASPCTAGSASAGCLRAGRSSVSACVRGGGLLSPQSRSRPLARSVLVATVAGFGVGLLIGWRRAQR